jgi:Mn-dependent DtxR family transcriptional regulator
LRGRRFVSESILNKALEFLGEITTSPAVEEIPKKRQLRVTKKYEKLPHRLPRRTPFSRQAGNSKRTFRT